MKRMRKQMNSFKSILFLLASVLLLVVHCEQSTEKERVFVCQKIDHIIEAINEPVIPDRLIDLCEFSGHQADEAGCHDFYKDIRNAIDKLSQMGGGTLLFSHSMGSEMWIKQTEVFRVKGPIVLKSHIELRFHPNVKLFFEFDPFSYLPDGNPVLRRYEGTTLYSFCPLIYAFNVKNIAITFSGGSGALPVIHGDGEKWQKWSYSGDVRVQKKGKVPAYRSIRTDLNDADVPITERICMDTSYHFLRPTMMEFIHCQHVRVEGVKLVESPFWVVHPVFTREMIMRNVMFDCQVVNNDGIDIESSSFVLVENVIFDNHDDNVAIKSGRNSEGMKGALITGSEFENINSPYVKNGRITAPTEYVAVRNCVFKGHYAFCVGSEASGGANQIFVTNCSAPMDVQMGVFLKSGRERGGIIQNIYVNDIHLNQVRNDVICLIPNYDNDTTSVYPPVYKDIYIQNVTVSEAGRGIRVFGWEDAPIQNVKIENIKIDVITSEDPKDIFLINQVENVRLKNVRIQDKKYEGQFNQIKKGAHPPRQG